MKRLVAVFASILLAASMAGAARAAAAPVYDVKDTWGDTNLQPGGEGQFSIQIRNIGVEDGSGELKILIHLPAGVTATHVGWPYISGDLNEEFHLCTGIGTETIECKLTKFLVEEYYEVGLARAPSTKKSNGLGTFGIGACCGFQPDGYLPTLFIDVAIDPAASGTATSTVTISGGGASEAASDVDQVPFGETPAPFGLVPGSFIAELFNRAYPFGAPERTAGSHPFELRFNFDLTAKGPQLGPDGTHFVVPHGTLKTAKAILPLGMSGNPEAVPKCDPSDFSRPGSTINSTGCPANTQVGYLNVPVTSSDLNYGMFNFYIANGALSHIPIYNLKPPRGVLADLGLNAAGYVQAHIYPNIDPAHHYAIASLVPNVSSLVSVRGSEAVIWGVPGDPSHDKFRYYPKDQENGDVAGAPFGGAVVRPFLTMPTDCGVDNGGATIQLDSYQHPEQFTPGVEYEDPLDVIGCDDPRFRFEPSISMQPTDIHAGAPTGLDVHLNIPQGNDSVTNASNLYAENEFVEGIATPPIKKAVVTLPQGMTLSPSAAQGLQTCSAAQIGLDADTPIACPDASQYGTMVLRSPALPQDKTVLGHVFIAEQDNDPSHSFLGLYLGIEDEELGLRVKLRGEVRLDPDTGQITTSFENLPQLPVSDMQLSINGGVRAGLVNPSTCGRKVITATFYSWHDPTTPHTVTSSYDIAAKPDGTSCVNTLGERPFKPSLEAGTLSNAAGTFSPFALRLTRSDEDQEFSQLGVKTPIGLLARLSGMSRCSDADIAQAISRSGRGEGVLEQRDPSCPASSQIGVSNVGAGVGVPLTYVPGKLYLAGPYHGSPLSVVVITPAVVGPFDIGVIAVRSAIDVNPETTQASVSSDAFPQIFQGIPVRIRDIRAVLDHPGWVLNPTSCAEKQISARVTGSGNDVNVTGDDTAANLANRFQAADCASLNFKPKLSFRLIGGARRGAHPSLKAVLRAKPGDANIGSASVALPHSEFLDQGHIKTVCTRVQFAARQCPAGSVYGHVTARSPLFDESFSGPLYLRSSSHPLPDLVAALQGPDSLPIEVDAIGRIDSVNGGIRTTFETVPDAPITSFTLTMQGKKKGLLVNSTNLCTTVHRATAKFEAQNGKRVVLRPEMQTSCREHSRSKRGGR